MHKPVEEPVIERVELAAGQVWRVRLKKEPLRPYAVRVDSNDEFSLHPAYRMGAGWFADLADAHKDEHFDWSDAQLVQKSGQIDYMDNF